MKKGFSRKGKKFLLHRVLPTGLILAACTGCAYVVNSAQYNDHFLPGTVLNGINVSDLTLQEAEQAIRSKKDAYTLTVKFRDGEEETITTGQLGLTYDCTKELQQIMNEQNRHAWLSRELAAPTDTELATTFTVPDRQLTETISALPEMQAGNYVKPSDAVITLGADGSSFNLIPEVEGTEISGDALKNVVTTAIEEGQTVLDLTSAAGEKVYEAPKVRSDNKGILKRQKKLNRFLSASITIHMSDGTDQVLDSRITKGWIGVDSGGQYDISKDALYRQVKSYVADLARKDDNYGFYRSFMTTNYGMQKFESERPHGHALNQSVMAKAITQLLLKGRKAELDPVYVQCIDMQDPRFGGTYAEVDIYEQRVYYYRDYELVYDCACVTGTESYSRTPSGIFSVEEKIRGRNLQGYNSAGEMTYSVWVNFWICFLPHYGLHDASWRGEFGGDIYEYDGSHGCVNLSYSSAERLYELLDYGTPVIVVRGETA